MLTINPKTQNPYMTDEDWKLVRHFSPKEKWGNWRKVYRDLIFTLDAFAEFVGRRVILHNVFDVSGHSDGSYHYVGQAGDLHVEGLHVIDQFIAASRFDGFNGLGVYPNWINPGLHCDIRPKSNRLLPDSLWMCRESGVYIPLSWQNIKEAFHDLK